MDSLHIIESDLLYQNSYKTDILSVKELTMFRFYTTWCSHDEEMIARENDEENTLGIGTTYSYLPLI